MRLTLLALALLTPTLSAQSWQDPTTWSKTPAPIESKDIIYGDPTDPGYDAKAQVLDVFQNASAKKPAPVLIYMHGGAWNHGTRPDSWHGFRSWMAAGFSVVNVEYRMADAHFAPAAVQDARCVLSWVKQNATKYNLDPKRVVTYGTSAGGHLALMAAVLPDHNDIDPPKCRDRAKVVAVLDFYGPYHLEPSAPGAFTSKSTARWMGPDPQPSLEAKEHAMSPSTYVRKGIPPVFIAYGDADPTVPPDADRTLKADLDRLGVPNAAHVVLGGKHGGWTPEENESVQLDSLKFLASFGIIR